LKPLGYEAIVEINGCFSNAPPGECQQNHSYVAFVIALQSNQEPHVSVSTETETGRSDVKVSDSLFK